MNKYKQRRFSASDNSRVLLDVSTTNGLCIAVRVPNSGTETWKSLSTSNKNASNSASARSISSINRTVGSSHKIAFNNGLCSRKRLEKKTSSSFAKRSAASASEPAVPSVSFNLSRSNCVYSSCLEYSHSYNAFDSSSPS